LKLSPLLDRIASQPPTFTIFGRDGKPYMSRYRVIDLGKERGRVYLNHFHRGDEDRELHNHPWHGVSLILAGGYREERREGRIVVARDYKPGDVNVICPDTFHRVDLLEADCWTLFATGPVVQSWGFWSRVTGDFTPWREFVRSKGLVPRGEAS